jgi:hypothetical protein
MEAPRFNCATLLGRLGGPYRSSSRTVGRAAQAGWAGSMASSACVSSRCRAAASRSASSRRSGHTLPSLPPLPQRPRPPTAREGYRLRSGPIRCGTVRGVRAHIMELFHDHHRVIGTVRIAGVEAATIWSRKSRGGGSGPAQVVPGSCPCGHWAMEGLVTWINRPTSQRDHIRPSFATPSPPIMKESWGGIGTRRRRRP